MCVTGKIDYDTVWESLHVRTGPFAATLRLSECFWASWHQGWALLSEDQNHKHDLDCRNHRIGTRTHLREFFLTTRTRTRIMTYTPRTTGPGIEIRVCPAFDSCCLKQVLSCLKNGNIYLRDLSKDTRRIRFRGFQLIWSWFPNGMRLRLS